MTLSPLMRQLGPLGISRKYSTAAGLVLHDTFGVVSDTLLTAWTPVTVNTYNLGPYIALPFSGTNALVAKADGNNVVGAGNVNAFDFRVLTGMPVFTNYSISVDGYWTATGGRLILVWRYSDANNFCYGQAGVGSGAITIFKVVAGVQTNLGAVAFNYPSNTPHRLTMTVTGDAMSLTFKQVTGGTLYTIGATDSFNNTATGCGLSVFRNIEHASDFKFTSL